jgi:hypothetical protein
VRLTSYTRHPIAGYAREGARVVRIAYLSRNPLLDQQIQRLELIAENRQRSFCKATYLTLGWTIPPDCGAACRCRARSRRTAWHLSGRPAYRSGKSRPSADRTESPAGDGPAGRWAIPAIFPQSASHATQGDFGHVTSIRRATGSSLSAKRRGGKSTSPEMLLPKRNPRPVDARAGACHVVRQ